MRHSRFQYATKVTARIEGIKRDFTLDEVFAITVLWKKTNARRADLISKKFQGNLVSTEIFELKKLQKLADHRGHIVSLLPDAHTSFRSKWSKYGKEVDIRMEYVDYKKFTLQEVIDIVFHFKKKNKRRHVLIDKQTAHEVSGGEPLTAKESEEFKYLQELSGYWRHLYHPLPWPTIHKLEIIWAKSRKRCPKN